MVPYCSVHNRLTIGILVAIAICLLCACTANRTEPSLMRTGYAPLTGLNVTKTDVGVAIDDFYGRIVPTDGWNTRWLTSVPLGGGIVFNIQSCQVAYLITLREIEGKEYAAFTQKDEGTPSLLILLDNEGGHARAGE